MFILGTYCLRKQTKINKEKRELPAVWRRRLIPWPPAYEVREGSWVP